MKPSRQPKSGQRTHRVYLNRSHSPLIRCQSVTDAELATIAEQTECIVIHEAGPNTLPASEVNRIKSILQTLQWPHRHLMSNPSQFRRIFMRQLGDRRALLRLKTGRTCLAGIATLTEGDVERQALIVVLAPHRVQSSDIQI
jgi:hypothetical protein